MGLFPNPVGFGTAPEKNRAGLFAAVLAADRLAAVLVAPKARGEPASEANLSIHFYPEKAPGVQFFPPTPRHLSLFPLYYP
jgi:hypothetical protein